MSEAAQEHRSNGLPHWYDDPRLRKHALDLMHDPETARRRAAIKAKQPRPQRTPAELLELAERDLT